MTRLAEATPEQNLVIRLHLDLVTNIARSLANTSKQLDERDIVQHIVLRWMDRWEELLPFVEEDHDGNLIVSLRNLGRDFVRKELRQINGPRHPDDLYFYSRSQLQDLLPLIETPEVWSSFAAQAAERTSSKPDPAVGGNALAMYADLRMAWEALLTEQRGVLRARYVKGLEYTQLALIMDLDEGAVRKRVERAVTAMQRTLGGAGRARPVQRRRAMSNAAAQVLTRQAYTG